MQADTAALNARLEAVILNPKAVFSLWWAIYLRPLICDSIHGKTPRQGETIVLHFLLMCADGRLFPSVAELFASARLIAIVKPSKPGKPPGIRPI